MITNEDIVNFFNENDAISISVIEKKADLPHSTLSKAIKGNRKLNKEHIRKVLPVIKQIGFDKEAYLCRTLAVVNNKGGVSKTTTVHALGVRLAELGFKVLIVDLDNQSNLTANCGIEDSSFHILSPGVKPLNIKENLDLIPCNMELDELQEELAGEYDQWTRVRSILRPYKEVYDFIIIDTAPSLGLFTGNAVIASDEIIIPTQAQRNSVEGLNKVFRLVENIGEKFERKPKISGILVSQYQNTSVQKMYHEILEEKYEDLLFKANIPLLTVVQQAVAMNVSIFEFDSKNQAVKAYIELADEILNQMN
ncbi:ParA family protein [Aureibacter tunicatorum]|uniref:Chromosome partitioning protein n=1 Tax=Aureibacter tunicatorum TaxID=866807 RepID=A0AAE3XSA8_9BACT|nr:ParA family protein [Aureibacter tunicatorum]MDR6241848.1 chromosome partitioning protein [Aureibacter tunicatorum]BDD07095.1 sporulation initiation inhibitor Soj [Aureibacter tunicatorum]